jgi:hypothetical protein
MLFHARTSGNREGRRDDRSRLRSFFSLDIAWQVCDLGNIRIARCVPGATSCRAFSSPDTALFTRSCRASALCVLEASMHLKLLLLTVMHILALGIVHHAGAVMAVLAQAFRFLAAAGLSGGNLRSGRKSPREQGSKLIFGDRDSELTFVSPSPARHAWGKVPEGRMRALSGSERNLQQYFPGKKP